MSTNEGEPRGTGLTPEEQANADMLRAMLNAYDLAPRDVQEQMLASARGENPGYVVPAPLMEAGAVAIQRDNPEKTRAQAVRDVEALQDAGRQIPGVRRLVGVLARSVFNRGGKK